MSWKVEKLNEDMAKAIKGAGWFNDPKRTQTELEGNISRYVTLLDSIAYMTKEVETELGRRLTVKEFREGIIE